MKFAAALILTLIAGSPCHGAEPRKATPASPRDLLLEQAFGNRLEAMARPEVAVNEAKYLRALYKALIAEGFTEEEAFELVVHHKSLLLSR